jgi:ABC-type polysaccharide transport system permease subunit
LFNFTSHDDEYCGNEGFLFTEYIGFEDFATVTMKNAVFLDIKTLFLPHWRHIMSPLQTPVMYAIRFDVSKAETMKNAVFLDVTPYGSCYIPEYCILHDTE